MDREAMMARAAIRYVALTAVIGTACAGRPPATDEAPAPATAERSVAELEALYRARVDSERARVSDADVRFMTEMIAHHAQALAMARVAPSRGASGDVLQLAARIENAQADEITFMQQWLRDRGRPVPAADGDAHGHAADTHGRHAVAPGMLTAHQLAGLAAARGEEFDRLFLLLMIQHHRGALEMAQHLLNSPDASRDAAVSMLATEINADQTTEIALMVRLLAALPAAGRPR